MGNTQIKMSIMKLNEKYWQPNLRCIQIKIIPITLLNPLLPCSKLSIMCHIVPSIIWVAHKVPRVSSRVTIYQNYDQCFRLLPSLCFSLLPSIDRTDLSFDWTSYTNMTMWSINTTEWPKTTTVAYRVSSSPVTFGLMETQRNWRHTKSKMIDQQ